MTLLMCRNRNTPEERLARMSFGPPSEEMQKFLKVEKEKLLQVQWALKM